MPLLREVKTWEEFVAVAERIQKHLEERSSNAPPGAGQFLLATYLSLVDATRKEKHPSKKAAKVASDGTFIPRSK